MTRLELFKSPLLAVNVDPAASQLTKRRSVTSEIQPASPLSDCVSHVSTPTTPIKLPQGQPSPPFDAYKSSWSRGIVYYAMAPVMWLAKVALTTYVRSMGAKRHVYDTVAGPISVWDVKGRGTAPTVVLLHGLGGSSAEYFPTLGALKARCQRVVAIDLPGHGHSPPLDKHTPAGFDGVHAASDRAVAGMSQAVQTHLQDAPAGFIGHSLGGFFAAHVAAERHARGVPTKLLFTESDGAPWSPERLAEDRRAFCVGSFAAARQVARNNYPNRPMLGWLYTPFLWARLASPAIQYLTHSDLKQPILEPSLLAALPDDTMIIVGRHDKFGAPEDVAYFCRHLPTSASLHRPNTGHGDIADAHDEICTIIDAFLRLD